MNQTETPKLENPWIANYPELERALDVFGITRIPASSAPFLRSSDPNAMLIQTKEFWEFRSMDYLLIEPSNGPTFGDSKVCEMCFVIPECGSCDIEAPQIALWSADHEYFEFKCPGGCYDRLPKAHTLYACRVAAGICLPFGSIHESKIWTKMTASEDHSEQRRDIIYADHKKGIDRKEADSPFEAACVCAE